MHITFEAFEAASLIYEMLCSWARCGEVNAPTASTEIEKVWCVLRLIMFLQVCVEALNYVQAYLKDESAEI